MNVRDYHRAHSVILAWLAPRVKRNLYWPTCSRWQTWFQGTSREVKTLSPNSWTTCPLALPTSLSVSQRERLMRLLAAIYTELTALITTEELFQIWVTPFRSAALCYSCWGTQSEWTCCPTVRRSQVFTSRDVLCDNVLLAAATRHVQVPLNSWSKP